MAKQKPIKGLRSIPLDEDQRRLIVLRRKELGLSQQQLADKLGCIQLSIYNIEVGKYQPKPEVMDKLCKALGLEYDVVVSVFVRVRK